MWREGWRRFGDLDPCCEFGPVPEVVLVQVVAVGGRRHSEADASRCAQMGSPHTVPDEHCLDLSRNPCFLCLFCLQGRGGLRGHGEEKD